MKAIINIECAVITKNGLIRNCIRAIIIDLLNVLELLPLDNESAFLCEGFITEEK